MKFLKNNLKVIIAFIVGVILAGGIVYAATSAKDVTYTTSKNGEIKNVEEALNDLYNKKTSAVLLWTNENPTSDFSPSTIALDLTAYDYIIIDGAYNTTNVGEKNRTLVKKGTSQYIPVGTFYNSNMDISVAQVRQVTVTNNGVTFSKQYDYNSRNNPALGIPYHIWGLKLNDIV